MFYLVVHFSILKLLNSIDALAKIRALFFFVLAFRVRKHQLLINNRSLQSVFVQKFWFHLSPLGCHQLVSRLKKMGV